MTSPTAMPSSIATAGRRSPRALLCGVLEHSRLVQFAALLAFALLVRGATFGEWNYDIDEQFYALVGRRLLQGATLYVDIWDRKPPALYLVYAAIALISPTVLAFQLAAALSATLGAFGITRIAGRFTAPLPAMMAGVAYLALLGRFGGASGQAPVWYTTLMIFAAWAIVARIEVIRAGRIDAVIGAGMLAAGLAITFKQSAAIEAAFFGLFIACTLVSSGRPLLLVAGQGGVLASLALLPIAATFAWYWQIGHLPELWQALVSSNFSRLYESAWGRLWRLGVLTGLLGLPLLFAGWGWSSLEPSERRDPRLIFISCWAVVAVLAVAVFPNIFYHYAIPILPPLCVLCAVFFARRSVGRIGFVALLGVGLVYGNTLNLLTRVRAHEAAPVLLDYVRAETPHNRLLIWGIPNYLYVLTGATPPSRLAFPPHLYEGAESRVSGIDEVREMQRIIAGRPETVVAQTPLPARPINQANVDRLNAYLKTCRKQRRFTIYDHNGAQVQTVYSRCGGASA